MGEFLGWVIGGILVLAARITWFFLRAIWWIGLFLICSLLAGVAALTRTGRPEPDETVGFGEYSEDCQRWQDQASGQWFPVSPTDVENCEVKVEMGGFAWRRMAIARLTGAGAIVRYTFFAVSEDASSGVPEIVSSVEFLHEARHNITIDNLDPALASVDQYNLAWNRDMATEALTHLEWLLAKRGWEPDGRSDQWYARRYRRPLILWNEPLVAVTNPEEPDG
ncbi:MAG: hypothetical protein JWN52_323 [Actinomycetia bacterium]|nr:hypothetical protein [Actinomycetes bacterium]